jgi:hypothetical protein
VPSLGPSSKPACNTSEDHKISEFDEPSHVPSFVPSDRGMTTQMPTPSDPTSNFALVSIPLSPIRIELTSSGVSSRWLSEGLTDSYEEELPGFLLSYTANACWEEYSSFKELSLFLKKLDSRQTNDESIISEEITGATKFSALDSSQIPSEKEITDFVVELFNQPAFLTSLQGSGGSLSKTKGVDATTGYTVKEKVSAIQGQTSEYFGEEVFWGCVAFFFISLLIMLLAALKWRRTNKSESKPDDLFFENSSIMNNHDGEIEENTSMDIPDDGPVNAGPKVHSSFDTDDTFYKSFTGNDESTRTGKGILGASRIGDILKEADTLFPIQQRRDSDETDLNLFDIDLSNGNQDSSKL